IRKAVDWLIARSHQNGAIGELDGQSEGSRRYTFGHGYAMLFLAQVYGEAEDLDQHRKLGDVLTRAAAFSVRSQTSRGGWGYVSARDGGDFDEGATTVVQVQALRAVRDAGIVVSRETLDKAHNYLKESTNEQGGVIYGLQREKKDAKIA